MSQQNAEYRETYFTPSDKSLAGDKPNQDTPATPRIGRTADGQEKDVIFIAGGYVNEEWFRKLANGVTFKLNPEDRAREEPTEFEQGSYYGKFPTDIKGGLVTLSTDIQARNWDNGNEARYSRVPRVSQLPDVRAIENNVVAFSMNVPNNPNRMLDVVKGTGDRTDGTEFQVKLSSNTIEWFQNLTSSVQSFVNENYLDKSTYDPNNDGVVNRATEANSVRNVGQAGTLKYYGTDGSGQAGFWDIPIVSVGFGDLLQDAVANRFLRVNSDGDDIEYTTLTKSLISGLRDDDTPEFNAIRLDNHLIITDAYPTGIDIDNLKSTVDNLDGISGSVFNENTILKSDTDDNPVPLTVPEATIIGRLTGGTIEALTTTEVKDTLLGLTDSDYKNSEATKADIGLDSVENFAPTEAQYNAIQIQSTDVTLTTPSERDLLLYVGGEIINGTLTKDDVGLSNLVNELQLVAGNNLSDLDNVATAQTNIGSSNAVWNASEAQGHPIASTTPGTSEVMVSNSTQYEIRQLDATDLTNVFDINNNLSELTDTAQARVNIGSAQPDWNANRIQGTIVANVTPTNNSILYYNGTNYTPGDPATIRTAINLGNVENLSFSTIQSQIISTLEFNERLVNGGQHITVTTAVDLDQIATDSHTHPNKTLLDGLSEQAALTAAEGDISGTAPSGQELSITSGSAGFGSSDQALTLVQVVSNMQTRINELESRLQANNLIA